METPAPNGRFGAAAAIAPQKRQCKFERLYPAGSFVEAATSACRHHVMCHIGFSVNSVLNKKIG